jgi:hypothetical protein
LTLLAIPSFFLYSVIELSEKIVLACAKSQAATGWTQVSQQAALPEGFQTSCTARWIEC